MHTRMKRSDILSAAERGYCLLCGGTNGECTCRTRSVVLADTPGHIDLDLSLNVAQQFREFCDFRTYSPVTEGSDVRDVFHYCKRCDRVSAYNSTATLLACPCGVIFKHDFKPSEPAQRDFTELLNVEDLPRSALRKPNIYR